MDPVPSERLLCLYCGAVAVNRLAWQLAAFFHGEAGLSLLAPFLSDADPWLEGTLEKAAQGACEGLCLQDDTRINSQTVIFPLDEADKCAPVKPTPLSSLLM